METNAVSQLIVNVSRVGLFQVLLAPGLPDNLDKF